MAVDSNAASASPTAPAFVAPPEGAPVYYGFRILHDVVVEDFTFGAITDFEAEPCEYGDAFVIAPDGSRAGLVWEVSAQPYFNEVMPLEPDRWGVWGVSFSHPMVNRDDARKNLAAILLKLRQKWEEWKERCPTLCGRSGRQPAEAKRFDGAMGAGLNRAGITR